MLTNFCGLVALCSEVQSLKSNTWWISCPISKDFMSLLIWGLELFCAYVTLPFVLSFSHWNPRHGGKSCFSWNTLKIFSHCNQTSRPWLYKLWLPKGVNITCLYSIFKYEIHPYSIHNMWKPRINTPRVVKVTFSCTHWKRMFYHFFVSAYWLGKKLALFSS